MALEDFSEAEKWALEAKDIFETKLEDPHGAFYAYLNLGGAWRKIAERDAERGRNLAAAIAKLKEAAKILQQAIDQAEAAGMKWLVPGAKAEAAKVNRSLGRLYSRQGGLVLGIPYYRESEQLFRDALKNEKWNLSEKADITEDLAEVYFCMGDLQAANKCLSEVVSLLGADNQLLPGKPVTNPDVPNRVYLPLGKVERLKGEMAADKEDYLKALQHFTLAYAYFERFSETAVEKNRMTQTLYGTFLSRLPSSQQRDLMRGLREWLKPFDSQIGDVSVKSFVDALGRLLSA
jgi:tetratricopeptide (TPR) repeat protein